MACQLSLPSISLLRPRSDAGAAPTLLRSGTRRKLMGHDVHEKSIGDLRVGEGPGRAALARQLGVARSIQLGTCAPAYRFHPVCEAVGWNGLQGEVHVGEA